MRGVNTQNMEEDYDAWNSVNKKMETRNFAFDAFKAISAAGANTVRILWYKDVKGIKGFDLQSDCLKNLTFEENFTPVSFIWYFTLTKFSLNFFLNV